MMLAVDNKQSLPCNVILNALHHLLFGGLTENILYSVALLIIKGYSQFIYDYAIEFRHPPWGTEGPWEMLKHYDIAAPISI
jgi:hypothetical protein